MNQLSSNPRGASHLTIAACHLSPEGVVLGADSASTISGPNTSTSHLDYAQKVFEVGPPGSAVGVVTWGLGQIGQTSHRSIVASVGFAHARTPATTLAGLADRLASELWRHFQSAYPNAIQRFSALVTKLQSTTVMSQADEQELEYLMGLAGGYCLGGRVTDHGPCEAFTVLWGPQMATPKIEAVPPEQPIFWGVPAMMERLIFGIDSATYSNILKSGKWKGTEQDLLDILAESELIAPGLLPIREAVDWVHTVIHTTIRGVKFAKWPHVCGGPVEIAVITTDRPFRWVCHKPLDAAIITAGEYRR